MMYMHCRQCVESLPEGVSPKEHARFEVSFDGDRVDVQCVRHEAHVVSFLVLDGQLVPIGRSEQEAA